MYFFVFLIYLGNVLKIRGQRGVDWALFDQTPRTTWGVVCAPEFKNTKKIILVETCYTAGL